MRTIDRLPIYWVAELLAAPWRAESFLAIGPSLPWIAVAIRCEPAAEVVSRVDA